MPRRIEPLVTSSYYHVFNRGVAKSDTFNGDQDYYQARLSLSYYRFTGIKMKLSRFKQLPPQAKQEVEMINASSNQLVDIIAYVMMPNHFHLLLQQKAENGISVFVSRVTNSYTRYFNTKYSRIGPLFQGQFKAVQVETNEQLLHLSRYIHLNPLVSNVIKLSELTTYPWSSLPNFLSGKNDLVNSRLITAQFSSPSQYLEFMIQHSDYARELELVKHQLIDD